MQTVLKFITILLLTLSCLHVQGQNDNEIKIYNSIIDSLYELRTCFRVIYPPYYKCCDIDTLPTKDFIKCCENSNVPKQYRVYCLNCANKQEFDTLEVLMMVNESFSTLNVEHDKKYPLSQIDKNSVYYNFIKGIKRATLSSKLSADSLKQQNIKFITKADFAKNGFEQRFGKYRKQIFLDYFDFSRIHIDKTKGLGLFRINWLGGSLCGYNKYFLIYRVNDVWKIYKKIETGVY